MADDGAHSHDGFYLRLGAGVGLLTFGLKNQSSADFGNQEVDGELSAGALSFELAVGGSPSPGLAIGGALYFDVASKATSHDMRINNQPVDDFHDSGASTWLLGPFADYYFNPRKGWHLEGSLGLALLTVGDATEDGVKVLSKRAYGGVGGMIGGGYEWWVADQWGMGVLLRATVLSLGSAKAGQDQWSYGGFAFPEVLFSATYQ